MRFMLMHKTNASNEAGLRPAEELIAGVGRTIQEMQEAGIFPRRRRPARQLARRAA
jgi:hypothetical protein